MVFWFEAPIELFLAPLLWFRLWWRCSNFFLSSCWYFYRDCSSWLILQFLSSISLFFSSMMTCKFISFDLGLLVAGAAGLKRGKLLLRPGLFKVGTAWRSLIIYDSLSLTILFNYPISLFPFCICFWRFTFIS